MTELIVELQFWAIFFIINFSNYFIVYILHHKESSALPFISDIKKFGRLGLASSVNLDFFRFNVEFSIILICSRFFQLQNYHTLFTALYFFMLLFNIYQYSFRRIYEAEPVLFNDLKILKNGLAIMWNESKVKILIGIFLFIVITTIFSRSLKFVLIQNYNYKQSFFFIIVFTLWTLAVLAIYIKKGFVTKYPGDLYLRYHFTLAEFIVNLQRSFECYKFSRSKFGKKFREARQNINLKTVENPPNIHFIFIESYGSFIYQSEKLKDEAYKLLEIFEKSIKIKGYHTISNLSESTTFGGQSWLTYSSVLFGCRMDTNTVFENLLNDKDFRKSNSLLHIFKNMGYTNYNLNPFTPISGITVPYNKMREMYCIDRYILHDDIKYTGNRYGVGATPPDQYMMNFTLDLIKKEKRYPYTFFNLTSNSHSPFPRIELVEDWEKINNSKGSVHEHKGFLKYPSAEDYGQAIKYQFQNLEKIISNHQNKNDLFILIGDHQPPMICKPEIHGNKTPIHIISENTKFLEDFKAYGFVGDLVTASHNIKHEAFYSIFLNIFSKHYAIFSTNIPAHEPEGYQF